MKVFTKDRDLLRPGITRFATEFISLESLIRYEADLKRMCTTNEWREFNKDRNRKSLRDKVFLLMKKVEKQFMKMMVPQIVDRRGGGTSGGSRGVGGTVRVLEEMVALGGYVSQVDPACHGHKEVKITMPHKIQIMDIDQGYGTTKAFGKLTTFPNDDDYSSGHDYHRSNYHRIDEHLQNLGIGSRVFQRVDDISYHNFRDRDSSSSTFSRNDFDRFPMMHPEDIQILEHELVIHMDMINLLVAVALLIEVLDTINMVLIPNSLRNHIFLIMDHQANHLNQHIRVMNNSFNHILTTELSPNLYTRVGR
ncbi:hypothetical protein CK203_090444 [Vitis vinifera]|uniref:Uncharacterized protein n=1 Tax=Vitis vinifera TaxID=29760 RepID=A0A438BVI2_VITVI|nr:hypothetical protein CK203_090444 [Vitis vinifera]